MQSRPVVLRPRPPSISHARLGLARRRVKYHRRHAACREPCTRYKYTAAGSRRRTATPRQPTQYSPCRQRCRLTDVLTRVNAQYRRYQLTDCLSRLISLLILLSHWVLPVKFLKLRGSSHLYCTCTAFVANKLHHNFNNNIFIFIRWLYSSCNAAEFGNDE